MEVKNTIFGRTYGWTEGRTVGRADGQMNGRSDRKTVLKAVCVVSLNSDASSSKLNCEIVFLKIITHT